MDDKVINAICEGRLFLDSNGLVLTPNEVFFGYHSETDFSMDGQDYQIE